MLIACTNASSSCGRSFNQSSHGNVWYSATSTTRAASFHNRPSARATDATFTGCQLRFNTSVGRCNTFTLIEITYSENGSLSGCPTGVEPIPPGSQPGVHAKYTTDTVVNDE